MDDIQGAISGIRHKIRNWASSLTEEQAKEALMDTVERLEEYEEIGMIDNLAPYWRASGESVVHGQQAFLNSEP